MALPPVLAAGRRALVAVFADEPVALPTFDPARGQADWAGEAASPPGLCFEDA